MRHRGFQKSNPSDLQINLELCHITEIIAVCKDSYVVYSVDLTEWENDDSQNQCVSMWINMNQ